MSEIALNLLHCILSFGLFPNVVTYTTQIKGLPNQPMIDLDFTLLKHYAFPTSVQHFGLLLYVGNRRLTEWVLITGNIRIQWALEENLQEKSIKDLIMHMLNFFLQEQSIKDLIMATWSLWWQAQKNLKVFYIMFLRRQYCSTICNGFSLFNYIQWFLTLQKEHAQVDREIVTMMNSFRHFSISKLVARCYRSMVEYML